MIKIKKTAIIFAVMLVSMAMVFSGCGLVKKNPQADTETVVAVVGGEQIMKTEFNQLFESYKVQAEAQYGAAIWEQNIEGRKYSDVMKERMLDLLVDKKVQEKEALNSGITVTEEEVNAEIDKVKKYFDSEEKFNEFLTTQKMTMEYLRDSMRTDILASKLKEKLTADVTVTDEEVNSYYATNQDQFVSVKASHILIEELENAKKVLERAKSGENFNELALEVSIDPSVKTNKGDLGYFRKGQMVEPFEKAAFALKPGEISDLVKTDFGYHIIKLEDKKTEKLEDIAGELKLSMIENKKDAEYSAMLEEMRTKADIKKYPKNL